MVDAGDLIECALCAACCYCCIKACEGQRSSSRRNNEPQTVIVQHQPYSSGQPFYPQGQPGGYYQGQPGQPGYYPPAPPPGGYPQQGYQYPPQQAYQYPPQHQGHPYPAAAASAPPPYDHSR